jgi:hypothetical protein
VRKTRVHQRKNKKKLPEDRLRELQRDSLLEIQDLQTLRQPRLVMRGSGTAEEQLETFTTYGTYQDPV